jgi:hypothetical protein
LRRRRPESIERHGDCGVVTVVDRRHPDCEVRLNRRDDDWHDDGQLGEWEKTLTAPGADPAGLVSQTVEALALPI